jgi:hypothetical protein
LTDKKPQEPKRSKRLIWILLLLLCLGFVAQWKLSNIQKEAVLTERHNDSLKMLAQKQADVLQKQNRTHYLDSLRVQDSIRRASDSLSRYQDSVKLMQGRSKGEFDKIWNLRQDSLKHIQDSLSVIKNAEVRVQDSLHQLENLRKETVAKLYADSLRSADSLRRIDSLLSERRKADQVPAQGLILPPAGRYYQDISLHVQCAEPKCNGFLSFGDSNNMQASLTPIALEQSGNVWWKVVDSVGNTSAWQKAEYDLASDHRCGSNAYPVPVSNRMVCVDAFEYPNQAEELPKDMVSHEMAVSLCAKEGKRLCALDEWQAACTGKDKQRYPYGERYDQTRCATAQKKVERSGRKEGCRSWWGMQDMAGNLWEWTSTMNPQRREFFYVAGGSWNTKDESACSSTKFSFYPQNQYPFVGFRCCTDVK